MDIEQFPETADILEWAEKTMKHDSEPQRLSRTPRLFLRPLAVRRYVIPDHGSVEAYLWRISYPEQAIFAVELRGLGARRFCLLAGDEARAREVFGLLARNTVTPCGLRDVLEEL